MQFEKPTLNGYTIYTKPNCPYCTKVKELLKEVTPEPTIILCDPYLTDPNTKEEFLQFIQSINGGTLYKTFPMVFHQGKFIGGFTETERYYSKENLTF